MTGLLRRVILRISGVSEDKLDEQNRLSAERAKKRASERLEACEIAAKKERELHKYLLRMEERETKRFYEEG